MKELKVKLDEPFKIIVTDSDGIEYFSDEYSFDPNTLITHDRGGSAELSINPFVCKLNRSGRVLNYALK